MLPLLRSLRPRQWVKNLVVFAGLGFGGLARDPASWARALAVFLAFCALSSAVYLANDVADRERDRRHPVKRLRPIAAGTLPVRTALQAAALLALLALTTGFLLGLRTGQTLAAYALLQALYTLGLKHVAGLDVLCIGLGFLLRVLAGAFAVRVQVSPWLLVCSAELALLLALCKRRAERALGGEEAGSRPSLAGYRVLGMDRWILATALLTLATYTAYALAPFPFLREEEIRSHAGEAGMVWTVPFVAAGLARYLYLVFRRQEGERPEVLALTDPVLVAIGLGWLGLAAWAVYGGGAPA